MTQYVRINFNHSTSSALHWKMGTGMPNWMKLLLTEFQAAYGVLFIESYESYLMSTKGIQYIATWLKYQGYKANYWYMEFEYIRNNTTETTVLAYGLEFQEDCEKFIELKMRASS